MSLVYRYVTDIYCKRVFAYRDVADNVKYLSSLGRAQTAVVIKNADIAIAEAERDATIRVGHIL